MKVTSSCVRVPRFVSIHLFLYWIKEIRHSHLSFLSCPPGGWRRLRCLLHHCWWEPHQLPHLQQTLKPWNRKFTSFQTSLDNFPVHCSYDFISQTFCKSSFLRVVRTRIVLASTSNGPCWRSWISFSWTRKPSDPPSTEEGCFFLAKHVLPHTCTESNVGFVGYFKAKSDVTQARMTEKFILETSLSIVVTLLCVMYVQEGWDSGGVGVRVVHRSKL